ncbi:MAG: hypothetical protein OXQ29_10420 [Rhodospirillaceae bacterium]|nr:hypothetical protein [Rhodospirillaceae bacterium]
MTVTLSHNCQRPATAKDRGSIDQIIYELSNDLRVLGEQARPEQDFESFERAVHERFVAAERAVLAGELQRLDVDVPEVTIGGRCLRRVLRSTETYLSGVGPITVQRTLYRTGSEPAVVALELRAGIVAGHWTPLAARQASLLVAHMTPQESVDTLRELGNMSPSRSSLDRLPKHLSSRWEQEREGFEEALRAATQEVPAGAATLAVSLDGVMAPMKDGDRQAKRAAAQEAGRATKGPAGFREVGCGTVSCYDGDGERLGTLRMGRMPEANKATLKQMLSAEVEAVLAQRPDLEVIKLADGARDNWSYLDELAPQAASSVTLVDFFHAAEQLRAAVDAAYGENDPWGRSQYEKHLHVFVSARDLVDGNPAIW